MNRKNIDDYVLIPTPNDKYCCKECITCRNSSLCFLVPSCSRYGESGVDNSYHFVLRL